MQQLKTVLIIELNSSLVLLYALFMHESAKPLRQTPTKKAMKTLT